MKKSINIKVIILVVYIFLFLTVFIWIIHPALFRPTELTQTEVPSFSVTKLKEAGSLFSSYGKSWIEFPTEPDINTYIFGQTDPI